MKAPRYWFDGSAPPLHARALARVYGAAARLRQRFVRARKVSRPVLVIGNLIAGGSGKTPLAIAVVERLKADGWTPGVASRGYGRDEAGTPRWVEPVTDPKLAGDEPVLIAARTGVKVRVDADRVAAAEALSTPAATSWSATTACSIAGCGAMSKSRSSTDAAATATAC